MSTEPAHDNSRTEKGTRKPTVELFGEAERHLDDTHIAGTEHILVDGDLLCGHPQLRGRVEDYDGYKDYTRYETDTPLLGYNTCENCARIYLREHGSRDEQFATAGNLDCGDWVRATLADGREIVGRIRRDVGDSAPNRFVKIVDSDLPEARWLTADLDIIRLRITEAEAVTEDGVDVTSLEPIEEPADSPDARLAATLETLEDIVGDRASTVMSLGTERAKFHLNVSGPITDLVDELEADAFEVTNVTPGVERSGTDEAAVTVYSR